MKIEISRKEDGERIMVIDIPYSQDPLIAVLNWCANMGYQYCEITTKTI